MLLTQKDVAKQLLDKFVISPKDTHIGLLTYGRESKIVKKLGQIRNQIEAENAITGVSLGVAGNNLVSLLKRVRTQFFLPSYGARSNVPKSLLIFVNGDDDVTTDELKEEAVKLREMGVKVVVLGFGENADPSKLRQLAPTEDAFFFGDDLPEILRRSKSKIGGQLLPGMTFLPQYQITILIGYISVEICVGVCGS